MKKRDLKNEFPKLYKASAKKMELVTVPRLNFLMCDGHGDPNNSQLFTEIVEALFSLSYTIKFMVRNSDLEVDYGVLPLEGIWWTDDMNNFSQDNKEIWKWTLMVMQPEIVTNEIIEKAKEQLKKKKDLPALNKVRFESCNEGLCAQVLYVGPYSQEGPTIMKLHAFIKDQGFQLAGRHREIYLSDMRRTAPEKLKTIIRQPVKN